MVISPLRGYWFPYLAALKSLALTRGPSLFRQCSHPSTTLSHTCKEHCAIVMQLRDSKEAGCDYGYDGEEEFHAILSSFVTYRQIVISLTRVT